MERIGGLPRLIYADSSGVNPTAWIIIPQSMMESGPKCKRADGAASAGQIYPSGRIRVYMQFV
jgi:hypothetical protein